MKLTPEEIATLKELLPPNLHKWIEYVPVPEPDEVETQEDRWGMERGAKLPESYYARYKPKPTPPEAAPPAAPKRKAEFLGLPKRPPLEEDVRKVLLDLALSDD